jgi:hypothetical protein
MSKKLYAVLPFIALFVGLCLYVASLPAKNPRWDGWDTYRMWTESLTGDDEWTR